MPTDFFRLHLATIASRRVQHHAALLLYGKSITKVNTQIEQNQRPALFCVRLIARCASCSLNGPSMISPRQDCVHRLRLDQLVGVVNSIR